jgi:hypothetical protein
MRAHGLVALGAGVLVALVVAGAASAVPPGWSGPTTVNSSQPPVSVSCPSSSFCAAVGSGGAAETFDGTTWSSPVVPDPGGSLAAVSCPSSSFCAAVDTGGRAISFNGSAWSAPVAVDTTRNALIAVSCTSAAFCVAGDGGGNGFVYNGSTWSAPITINHNSNQEAIGGISCVSTSFCVAAGQAGTIEISTSGGSVWSAPIQIGTNNLTAVSCPSVSFCVAVDVAGNAYTYNGTAWSPAAAIDTVNGQISGGSLDSVSCASSSFCVAIDGRENVVMFNGNTWSAPASLESGASLRPAVSCPSSSFCMAVDGGGKAFTFGAVVPSPGPPPAPVLGKSVNAAPVAGVVFVRLPGARSTDLPAARATAPGSGFVPLTEARQIPVGSEIDALHGALKLLSAGPPRHSTQIGTFGGAIFKVAQSSLGPSKGLTTLSLVEAAFKGAPSYTRCTRTRGAADASTAAAGSKTLQLLHASARGKFRTRGRYSAATVRGTGWSIADRCDGTLTHVVRGAVTVTDFVRHVTVLLHAGQSYLARAPRMGR